MSEIAIIVDIFHPLLLRRGRTGDTPYATNGDVPVVLVILLVLLLSAGTTRFPWRKMADKRAKNE